LEGREERLVFFLVAVRDGDTTRKLAGNHIRKRKNYASGKLITDKTSGKGA